MDSEDLYLLVSPGLDYASSLRDFALVGGAPSLPPLPALGVWYAPAACLSNTKGYSSTYLALGFANVRAGTHILDPRPCPAA